jgi:hypothetical protein
MTEPTITHADKEAYHALMGDDNYDDEKAGAWHFACHREAAEQAQAARIAELEAALEASTGCMEKTLAAVDAYNRMYGTYIGGPTLFTTGRMIADNRAALNRSKTDEAG